MQARGPHHNHVVAFVVQAPRLHILVWHSSNGRDASVAAPWLMMAGFLGAVAGILIAGRTGAVDLQIAGALLLRSVAAAVIGGTSIVGGVGIYTGTILGALIISVLNSMLTFLNVGQATQQVLYASIVLALAWGYAGLTRRTCRHSDSGISQPFLTHIL